MSRRTDKRLFYYPAVLYTALLLLVWLLSWAVGVAELALGRDATMHSLVSAEGVRWAVRSAVASVDSAPWGVIMLFISSLGLFMGSGIVKSVKKLLAGGSLALNERRAWLFAIVTTMLYVLLLFFSTLPPWNVLLGVTGDISASPLVQGYIILLFLGVFILTASYGFIYGNYRSMVDIARSVGAAFSLFAPALLALLPATGIVPCMEFAGLLSVANLSSADAEVVADVIFLLPFVYMILVMRRGGVERP